MVKRSGIVALIVVSAATIGVFPLSHVSPAHATVVCASVTTEGIDVSSAQGTIDWNAVAAAGERFAYVRVNSGLVPDTSAATNLSNARAAGVQVGAVDLGRPGVDAMQEANFFLAHASIQPGDLVPALDLEVSDGKSSTEITTWVQTWINVVEAALGTKPVIYTSAAFWNRNVGSAQFSYNPLWDAAWGVTCPNTPTAWINWSFWQYNNAGSVAGIVGTVNLDRFQGTNFTPVTLQAASTSSLVTSFNPSQSGQSVTFTATVAALPPGAGIPTGTVTFKDGSTTLGTAMVSTTGGLTSATYSTSTLAPAAHSITAVYGGDSRFTGSSSPALTQYVDINLSGFPTSPGGAYNLSGANLAAAYLGGANLARADMSNTNLRGADLTGANLVGANISNTTLKAANLTGANLTGANLSNSTLEAAILNATNFTNADLTGTTLKNATGSGTAIFSGVVWSNTTCPDSTLSTNDGGTCLGHLRF